MLEINAVPLFVIPLVEVALVIWVTRFCYGAQVHFFDLIQSTRVYLEKIETTSRKTISARVNHLYLNLNVCSLFVSEVED